MIGNPFDANVTVCLTCLFSENELATHGSIAATGPQSIKCTKLTKRCRDLNEGSEVNLQLAWKAWRKAVRVLFVNAFNIAK